MTTEEKRLICGLRHENIDTLFGVSAHPFHQLPTHCPVCGTALSYSPDLVFMTKMQDEVTYEFRNKEARSMLPYLYGWGRREDIKQPTTPKSVVVVSGLLIDPMSHRVLMALRTEDSDRPNLWEYPGGKVEKNESERDALVRELQEELGITTEVTDLVSVASYTLEVRVILLLYRVRNVSVQPPEPLTASELRWVHPSEAIQRLPMMPSTYACYSDVYNYIQAL